MSVLGNISKRLKTDIGENLRAQIDVDYSRQLTEDRFNQAAQDKNDRRDAQIRIDQRRNEAADEATKQKLALQIKAGDQLFQTGQDTDEWDGFLKYIDNPNLSPDVRDYMTGLAGAHGSRSIDGLRFEQKRKDDFAKLSQAEKRATLERDKYETSTQQKNADLQLKREKLRLEKMQDLRETNQTRNNRADMIEFIERTPDIETELEREAFLTRLKSTDSSPQSINKVWDEIMARLGDRNAEREKNHRAKLAGSAGGKTITDPSKIELRLAEEGLQDRIGDSLDDGDFDEVQRQALIDSVATKINTMSRDRGVEQSEVIQDAISETLAGFREGEGEGFFGFNDKPTFRLTREQAVRDLSEEDLQETMAQNPTMTRDQVIDAILRKQGID